MVLNNSACSSRACWHQHLTRSEPPLVAFGATTTGLPLESAPTMDHFPSSALFVNLLKQNFTCGTSHFFVPPILQSGVSFVLEWGIVCSRAGREQTISLGTLAALGGGRGRSCSRTVFTRGILGMVHRNSTSQIAPF